MKISNIQLKMRNTELTNRIALMATHGQQMITVLQELRSVLAEVRKQNAELKETLHLAIQHDWQHSDWPIPDEVKQRVASALNIELRQSYRDAVIEASVPVGSAASSNDLPTGEGG